MDTINVGDIALNCKGDICRVELTGGCYYISYVASDALFPAVILHKFDDKCIALSENLEVGGYCKCADNVCKIEGFNDVGEMLLYPIGIDWGFYANKNSVMMLPDLERIDELKKKPRIFPPTKDTTTKLTNPKDSCSEAKVGISCIPMAVLYEVALALVEGKLKYGANNWTNAGVRASVYLNAQNRHMTSWWCGQDIDPDSGIHHISKAIAGLMVLRDAQIRGMCTDDRPPPVDIDFDGLTKILADMKERHKDKNPKHFFKGHTEGGD